MFFEKKILLYEDRNCKILYSRRKNNVRLVSKGYINQFHYDYLNSLNNLLMNNIPIDEISYVRNVGFVQNKELFPNVFVTCDQMFKSDGKGHYEVKKIPDHLKEMIAQTAKELF